MSTALMNFRYNKSFFAGLYNRELMYSHTCLQRSPMGPKKSGLCWQEVVVQRLLNVITLALGSKNEGHCWQVVTVWRKHNFDCNPYVFLSVLLPTKMKLSFNDFVSLGQSVKDADVGSGDERFALELNVGITKWPQIEMEVSDHLYIIFW